MNNIEKRIGEANYQDPVVLSQKMIDAYHQKQEELTRILQTIEEGRKIGSVQLDKKEYISTLEYSLPVPHIGIRNEVLDRLRERAWEYFKDGMLNRHVPEKDIEINLSYDKFLEYKNYSRWDKAFYNSLGNEGDLKAAMRNIKRIMNAGVGADAYNIKQYDRSLFLEKEAGLLDYYSVQEDCYFMDLLRETFQDMSLEEVYRILPGVSVSMMHIHWMHTKKSLADGKYVFFGQINGEVGCMQVNKRSSEPGWHTTKKSIGYGRKSVSKKSDMIEAGAKLLLWRKDQSL